MLLEFDLNGKPISINVEPDKRFLDVLREDLGLTGAKEGCGEGECGACTVIMNGKAVNSCLLLAVQVQGQKVLTIEGLSPKGKMDPLQEAFIENHAVQCGYCTPGMIMSAKALLMANPDPDHEEIRRALAGNLCRCTGYNNIVRAVRKAAESIRREDDKTDD